MAVLTVLFPADPLNRSDVDLAFEHEAKAARQVGCFTGAVDIDRDSLDEDLEAHEIGEPVIYRGWMVTPKRYRQLYEALWERGFRLINSPDEYRYCHELPQWYEDFKGTTPKSAWGGEAIGLTPPEWDYAYIHVALGDGPYIVKDYVKSRKHEWTEACYIPSYDDLDRVTKRFIELQGEDLMGGVVHRQYVPLKQVGEHPKSGMPIFNEIRVWMLGGHILAAHSYWGPDEGGNDITVPRDLPRLPLVNLGEVDKAPDLFGACLLKSNFCTVDLAQHEHGRWVIVELGDGQVSGLPSHVDAKEFYRGLRRRFSF